MMVSDVVLTGVFSHRVPRQIARAAMEMDEENVVPMWVLDLASVEGMLQHKLLAEIDRSCNCCLPTICEICEICD